MLDADIWHIFNAHIFGIPIHDYPMDKLDEFSTNAIYNENGMHAKI